MHRVLAVLALAALCSSAMACSITGMDVVKVRSLLLGQIAALGQTAATAAFEHPPVEL
jgi:hypothetical protein